MYHISIHSVWFYWIIFASEVMELFLQLLALKEMSEAGQPMSTLVFQSLLVLANAFCPVVMYYALRHQKNRRFLALTSQRLLLFDAFCDILYAITPLVSMGLMVVNPEFRDPVVKNSMARAKAGMQKHLVAEAKSHGSDYGTGDLSPSGLYVYSVYIYAMDVFFNGNSLFSIGKLNSLLIDAMSMYA